MIAAVCWKPDRLTRVFGVVLVAATVWMLGDTTPLGRGILAALPVDIRIGIHPEFTLCAFGLAFAIVAALGAHRLLPRTWMQVVAGVVIAVDLDAKGEVIGVELVGVKEFSISRLMSLAPVEAPNFDFSRARYVPVSRAEW